MFKINVDFIYPIGSIYITTNTVNPGILFGGTWEAFATGRTLVGIDTSQTEFNVIEKTGGSKYLQKHTHTKWHEWRQYANNTYGLTNSIFYSGEHATGTGVNIGSGDVSSNVTTGDSGNLQPYVVVYMWKRIA